MINNHSHSWLWWDWGKIDYNDLLNKPSWWNVWTWYATHSWTADKKITVWFKPKYVHIFAIYTVTSTDYSKSWTVENDDLSLTTTTAYWDSSNQTLWSWDSSSVECVYVQWTRVANMASFDSDWFTLGSVNMWATIWMHFMVFW